MVTYGARTRYFSRGQQKFSNSRKFAIIPVEIGDAEANAFNVKYRMIRSRDFAEFGEIR